MIKEFLKYLNTPASSLARKMGYLYESIALEERYTRCQKDWQPHIDKCHKFVSENLSLAQKKETVLVLGSGHLIETPIEILCEQFNQVILVDIVHPKSVRKLAENNKKILLIETDLSGVAKSLIELKKTDKIPKPEMTDLLFTEPDLIISANILSQLPIVPRNYLEKKYPHRYSEIELNFFCQSIIESHLKMLSRFNKPVLLYTDTQLEVCDKTGQVIHQTASYSDLTKLVPTAEWIWNLAPIGEYNKKNSIVMKEKAYILKAS